MEKQTGDDSLLHETGDRWKLDLLIPNRDRRLVGPQIPRTDLLSVATKVRVVTDHQVDKSLSHHTPVYSRPETAMDKQRKLRAYYQGDQPRPGDRLL